MLSQNIDADVKCYETFNKKFISINQLLFLLLTKNSTFSKMNKSSQQIASLLTEQVHKALKKDLSKGHLNLPEDDHQHELPLINKSRVSKTSQKQQPHFHEIVKKRKFLQEQLQRVKLDQQTQKQKRVHVIKQIEEGKTKYFRSTITQQEKQKIKKVLKDTSEFEKQLRKKMQLLQQKAKEQKQKRKQIKQQQDKQKHAKKQKQVQQNMKLLQKRKSERTKQINDANRQFQRVSKLKFLHQKIEQKWKIIEKAEQQQNQKLFQRIREKKKFNIDQIKQHTRRYSQITISNQQKRQQNQQKLRRQILQTSRLAKHSYSTFLKTLTLQEQEKKQLQAQKIRQNQQLLKKVNSYATTVRQKNKSSFKADKPTQVDKKPRIDIRTSRSLDQKGFQKLGNDYMKQIHACIGESVTPILQTASTQRKIQQVNKYQDYLTKARLSRKLQNPQQDENSSLKQLKTIINKKNEDKQTKMHKAKILVNKLDQKAGVSSKNMINSILAKLSFIEKFAQSN